MKKGTRIWSLLLAAALTLSYIPAAAGAEEADIAQTEATVAETTLPEPPETEPATVSTEEPAGEPTPGETAAAETVPEETAAGTTPATEETTAPTEPVQITEPTESTEPTEETTGEPLLYGLTGLPEDYVLSRQELADKQEMAEQRVAQNTAALTAGMNYEEGVLLVKADSRQQAACYAAAFSAELVHYRSGMAKLRLTTATVVQALEAAQAEDMPLPAAYPNHITMVEPDYPAEAEASRTMRTMSSDLPQRQSWQTWVGGMSNPDTALSNPGATTYQYMHDVVDSYAAWGVTTGSGVTVAVLDTGVDADHPDLHDVQRLEVTDGAGNALGLGTQDTSGHGTHVAGIIAATMDNGRNGAGIAPDARILSFRVMDSRGYIYDEYLIAGIYDAVAAGAQVINISIGGMGYNQLTQDAVDDAAAAGVTIVASMGNDGTNCLNYPAGYRNVIGVVATDRTNTRANYSSYGTWADVAAPGSRIYSTYKNEGFLSMSGTSMATPVVTGVVALYKSVYPNATPAQVTARLKATATKGSSDLGAGIVNAANMLSAKPAAPAFTISDSGTGQTLATSAKTSVTVPCESVLTLSIEACQDKNEYILYTLDGTTPSVRSGAVANGIHYTGPVDLSGFSGKTLNLRAVQVNGLGMTGNVLMRKIQVQPGVHIARVDITGPGRLQAGKTGEFRAEVVSAVEGQSVSQSVRWRISDRSGNMLAAKLDANTGKLTTPKLSASEGSGWVDIVAQCAGGEAESQPFRVLVEALDPVAKISLSKTKLSCYTGNTVTLGVTMRTARGETSDSDVRWSSSNTSVASVDENGVVTARKKGSATITCKALDGSGKYARCSVTVQQGITRLTISGLRSIAPGSSTTLKVSVYPSTASKKVTWSVQGPAGVTISSGGTLKVAAGTALGEEIVVTAKPPAGAGEAAEYHLTIAPKCYSVRTYLTGDLGEADGYTPIGESYDRSGKLTGITLYSVDPAAELSGYPGKQDVAWVGAAPCARDGSFLDNDGCILWSSSNTSVASVDQQGRITAHKAGTATIYASAKDGSSKKASVTVKVLNPVSSFALSSSAPKGYNGLNLLAAGKSVTLKPVFATTYGKPSNCSLSWSYGVQDSDRVSHTADFADWISISSSGKLTVKSGAAAYIRSRLADGKRLTLTVTARSRDLTGPSVSQTFRLTAPTTSLKMETTRVSNIAGGICQVRFYCDQYCEYKAGVGYESDFVITSSNPKVASVSQNFSNVYSTNADGWYTVKIYSAASGSAKLTIKTTDGTGKSCSVTVRAYEK